MTTIRSYPANEIRDIALVGHGGSGKTTLADSVLWCARITQRPGRVDDDTSSFDFEPEEHKRKSTLSAAVGHVEWRKAKINLIDTSGNGNFLVDTRLALDVVDGAVVVVSAPDGVQVYTERTWQMLDEAALPRCVLLTKMDRERADFDSALVELRESLSDKCTPVQLPIGVADKFEGMVDLLTMKALRFDGEGRDVRVGEIPAEMAAAARAAREQLEEAVASGDDTLIEEYLETSTLTPEDFEKGLGKAVRSGALVPVLVAAPAQFIGIQPLLDLLVNEFPSPAERQPWKGTLPPHTGETEGAPAERAPDPAAPTAAYVWKTIASDIGHLSYLRVLSGRITSNSNLLSVNHGKSEHIGQLYVLQGKGRDNVTEAFPGDIVAVPKLKLTKTGDTLTDERAPFLVRRPPIPAPMISYAIHPKSKGDDDKLAIRLNELIDTDVALKVTHDAASKELLLGGTGQIHIEVAVDRLRRGGVDVELLPPRIPYLETLKGTARNVEGKHKKQTGGKGQFAVVYIDVQPMPRGGGFEFDDAVVGGSVPRQFIPAVEKGVRARMQRGVIAGYPVTDVKVRLFDGKYHDVDSDSRSFEIAASKGFQAGFKQARPTLLEPIMHVEVTCPEDAMGAIVGDLNHRRGRVEGMEARGRAQVVKALVPMGETLRYSSDLRSITGGRGSFSMEFSHYDELPPHLMDKVIADSRMAAEEDD
jgi:elongation factor G